MDEKDSYTPKEVAELCEAYLRVRLGFESEGVNSQTKERYKEVIPENVRDEISNLNGLEFLSKDS